MQKKSKPKSDLPNKCETCGEPTSNPRFCTRSCAAKYNNRKSPKRSPEGACKSCGTAISTSRSYCEECWKTREAERRNPQQRIHICQKTVFSIECPPITNVDCVGKFLDTFEKVAEATPCYLPPGDWQRHCDFVQFLRGFSARELRDGKFRAKPAVDFQVGDLEWLLSEWVESIVWTEDAHPLAATFALETAEILSTHARGETRFGYQGGMSFRLRPMVTGESPRWRSIAGQRLKREITEQTLSSLLVAAQLPEGVKATVYEDVVDCPTGKVVFIVERCHQSQGRGDQYLLEFSGGDWQPFDLSGDFKFFGQALVTNQEAMTEDQWDWRKHKPCFWDGSQPKSWRANAFLPIRWITECGTRGYNDQPLSPLPTHWSSLSGQISPHDEVVSHRLKLFDGDEN